MPSNVAVAQQFVDGFKKIPPGHFMNLYWRKYSAGELSGEDDSWRNPIRSLVSLIACLKGQKSFRVLYSIFFKLWCSASPKSVSDNKVTLIGRGWESICTQNPERGGHCPSSGFFLEDLPTIPWGPSKVIIYHPQGIISPQKCAPYSPE